MKKAAPEGGLLSFTERETQCFSSLRASSFNLPTVD